MGCALTESSATCASERRSGWAAPVRTAPARIATMRPAGRNRGCRIGSFNQGQRMPYVRSVAWGDRSDSLRAWGCWTGRSRLSPGLRTSARWPGRSRAVWPSRARRWRSPTRASASSRACAYSLVAMTQRAEPLMEARGGGAIVTMTYLGGERAIPGYNVMGVAKAALDASMRYLAADLGPKNIRVNAISAGPVRTLAARGIAGFSQMEGVIAERAPLKRGIDADDVGQAGLYLLSPMASSVTGTILYVDAGYHAMGL